MDKFDLYGCMIGRTAYENTFEIIKTDEVFYGAEPYLDRFKAENDMEVRKRLMFEYADYVEKLGKGEIADEFGHVINKPNPSTLVRPLLTLYNGERNCAKYRQFLSDLAKLKN